MSDRRPYTREEANARLRDLGPAFERCAMWLGCAVEELKTIEQIVAPSGKFKQGGIKTLRTIIEKGDGLVKWSTTLAATCNRRFPQPQQPPETPKET